MRSPSIILLMIIAAALLAMTEATWNSHHRHHEGAHARYPTCHYQSEKGTFDLRLLMRDLAGKDWNLTPEAINGALLFNPCSGISDERCAKDSVLCEITPKGDALNYGNYSAVHFAEVGEGSGFEMTFASGELCNNGVPRKTSVQFVCSEPTADPSTQISLVTMMQREECQIQLTIKSPYGCPAEQLCSVLDSNSCDASQDLCTFNHKALQCEMSAQDCRRFFGHLHLSHGALAGISVAGVSLILCGLGLCVCACRQRKRRCAALRGAANRVCRRRRQHKAAKQAEQAKADVEAPVEQQQQQQEPMYVPMQYVYHPQQQMAYAVLNPYTSNDIPMVQFAPSIQQQ